MKDREEQGGTGGLPSGGSGNLRSKGEKKKRRNTPEETLRDSGPQIVTRKKNVRTIVYLMINPFSPFIQKKKKVNRTRMTWQFLSFFLRTEMIRFKQVDKDETQFGRLVRSESIIPRWPDELTAVAEASNRRPVWVGFFFGRKKNNWWENGRRGNKRSTG